ncbi:zinc knuckle CX2CX4HX4C containing protein [Tanacetum coccineum]
MEQYLALTQGSQAPGMVKPEIGGNVNFEIKSQFMRELREDTFSRNKNNNAHEHVERVLDIAILFNIPGVSHDAVMLRVFPITLTGATKRWVDRLQARRRQDIIPSLGMKVVVEGITAIVNKLENLGRDMKKLKENVYAIQVGCQTCEGAHLDKDCPLNEEVKGMEEVKYGEFSRPFLNNRYDSRFKKGGYNQPSSREKRPSLTEVINKYIEEASKRQAEQDERLKKFYQSIEASRETHDKITQGLEGKVKTLANEVEGRANNKKFEECKIIYSKNRLPLYTPFYYSPEEIEYFFDNSGFSDNEEQETDDSRMAEAVAAIEATLKKKREEPKKVKQMKYLVENKPRTEEDNKIRMNLRCSALFQNHLPPKKQDPGSFILPCSIGKLDFKNALADLGASNSIMPFSMYKCLGIGKLKPINMLIEMADNTKCAPKGIVENLLIKINKFIFPVDFVILDMVEDNRMPIILERPLLATAHTQVDTFRKTISLEVGSEKVIFKMRSSFTTINFEYVRSIKSETFVEDDNLKDIEYDLFLYDSESSPQGKRKHWCSAILYGKVCKMTEERILKDHLKERFEGEEDDLEKYLEELEECGEDKANTMLWVIHDKLNNDWFNNTSEDKDDLERILDYLKPRSYDGFINLDDEAYNKRMCRLLGMTYEEPTPILIEKAKFTRYTVGLGETYIKVKVLGVEKIPRTRDNVAAIRARLMKKMAQEGNNQAKT